MLHVFTLINMYILLNILWRMTHLLLCHQNQWRNKRGNNSKKQPGVQGQCSAWCYHHQLSLGWWRSQGDEQSWVSARCKALGQMLKSSTSVSLDRSTFSPHIFRVSDMPSGKLQTGFHTAHQIFHTVQLGDMYRIWPGTASLCSHLFRSFSYLWLPGCLPGSCPL